MSNQVGDCFKICGLFRMSELYQQNFHFLDISLESLRVSLEICKNFLPKIFFSILLLRILWNYLSSIFQLQFPCTCTTPTKCHWMMLRKWMLGDFCGLFALVFRLYGLQQSIHNGLNPFLMRYNGILLPKLFWYTVRKKCFSDREKNFEIRGRRPRICKNFAITRTMCSNSERSEQFLITECFFNLFLEVSHIY